MFKPLPYVPSMTVVVHLLIIVPCVFMGAYLLLSDKGTPLHRAMGKVYMVLMGVTGLLTLFIPADVGPRFLGHFGFLHLLSLLTLWSVPRAWVAARRRDMRVHKAAMVRLYLGGILVAGAFAVFAEGRFLHTWFFK